MTGSGKSLRDLAGRSPSLRTSNALELPLETQRSIDKLTEFGAFRDVAIGRSAYGLHSPEMEKALAIASGTIASVNLPDPFEKLGTIRSAIEEATGKFGRIDTTAFGIAHSTAAKLSSLRGHHFGSSLDDRISDAMKRMTEPYSGLPASMRAALDIDRTAFGALSRSQHWADALKGKSARDYAALLGTSDKYLKQFEALNLAARIMAEATAGFNASGAVAEAARLSRPFAGIDITTTKLSLFASAIDVLGPGAVGSQAAYTSLLGGYSTTAMLDRPYWRDQRERARYYRDQDVDDGLIDADNAAIVQVLIESGVVEGRRTRAGTMTAVVEAGPVKLRIMASRPKMGAFGAIDAFENALRAFVSAKLEAVAGPNWFKHRVPGDITTRAKERRREAIRSGEPQLSLIHYTDLGDLMGVILRRDNWGEIFEMVFDRAEGLKVDLERLNTHRRPTMHSRPIEPVQLCEIVLTICRLIGWMQLDGTWDEGWDADI